MKTNTKMEIYKYICCHLKLKPPTHYEIQEKFGLALSTINEHIQWLKKEHYLRKDGLPKILPTTEILQNNNYIFLSDGNRIKTDNTSEEIKRLNEEYQESKNNKYWIYSD